MPCRALLALLVGTASAVRRLDLTATEGEVAGQYAFKGGEEEATCKACKAVMEHVNRKMAEPMYDEQGYFAGRKTRVAGSREEQAEKLNRAARVQAVLDPTTCKFAMKEYDLGYIGGENNFIYKDPAKPSNYPVHMELNDWAKAELALYCESLFEEKEDELTAAVTAADEAGGKQLDEAICKETLDLCKPPRPPPPEKPKGKMSKEERLKKAEEVFKGLDKNGDGHVDKREIQQHMKDAQRQGKLGEGRKVKDEVDSFFNSCDDDGDFKVTFEEYKQLWIKVKKKAKKGAKRKSGADPDTFLGFLRYHAEEAFEEVQALPATLKRLAAQARAYAQASPYVALASVSVMSAAVYVGGQVVRIW